MLFINIWGGEYCFLGGLGGKETKPLKNQATPPSIIIDNFE